MRPPEYTLQPLSDTYKNPRTLLMRQDDDAKTVLSFNGQSGSHYSFFVLIENKSSAEMAVYPEDIYEEFISGKPDLQQLHLYAADPEEQISIAGSEMNAANSQKSFNDGMNCLFVGALVATDIASIGKEKTEEEVIAKEVLWDLTLTKIENDEINYQNKMYELEEDISHWENEALRVAFLAPGEKTGGLFYVPVKQNADTLNVVIPVGRKEHVYTFQQVKK